MRTATRHVPAWLRRYPAPAAAPLVFVGGYCEYDFIERVAALDARGYRHTGPAVGGFYLCNRKDFVGLWFEARGLRAPAPAWVAGVAAGDGAPPPPADAPLPAPCVVKRSDSCGSYDQAVARTHGEFAAARARLLGHAIVVEPFVHGRELSVNFLDAALLSWFDFDKLGHGDVLDLTKKDKRTDWLTLRRPADLPPVVAAALPHLHDFIARLGLRDITRFDLRIDDATGRVHVMDANCVACCNFDLLTAAETLQYAETILALSVASS